LVECELYLLGHVQEPDSSDLDHGMLELVSRC
jgi:hypothetical protein